MAEKKPSKYEVAILDQMYAEGFQPNSEEFKLAFLARKVTKCQELHSVLSCQTCRYFDHCEMGKTNLRNLKNNTKVRNGMAGGSSNSNLF